jgi:hypothetical protein
VRTIIPHLLSLTRPLLQLAHSSTPIVSEGGLPVYGVLGNLLCPVYHCAYYTVDRLHRTFFRGGRVASIHRVAERAPLR